MSDSPARRLGFIRDPLENGLGKFGSFLKAGKELLRSDDAFVAECARENHSHPSAPGTLTNSRSLSSLNQRSGGSAVHLNNQGRPGVPKPGVGQNTASSPLHQQHLSQRSTAAPAHMARAASVGTALERLEVPGASDDASTSGMDPSAPSRDAPKLRAMSEHKIRKFSKILAGPVVNIDALRELAWGGIPADLRPMVWRLLLGYLPPAKARQATSLARKRAEYTEMAPRYYDISNSERSEEELGALRQVAVDVPRTAPGVSLFHQEAVQASLNRMLYIWGIRHPASGYVQGMNDLVTPFLLVFLSEHLPGPQDSWVVDSLPQDVLLDVEADCYWCLCKLIESIQDHYTYAQPGIQRTVFKIKELVRRVDEPVAAHLEEQSLDFLQFSFRWVNCLLIREIPFAHSVRLWDTYMAEGSHFNEFLVYICASFLLTWREKICQMEFQDLIIFLQKLPTADWDEARMEMMLSKAHIWRASFGEAQSHLKI